MWDRYDPRVDDRDRGESRDRGFSSRGASNERDRDKDHEPRDVFTRDLDLPRGRERRPVRERDRIYEIDRAESRMLATIGAAVRMYAEETLLVTAYPDYAAYSARTARVIPFVL